MNREEYRGRGGRGRTGAYNQNAPKGTTQEGGARAGWALRPIRSIQPARAAPLLMLVALQMRPAPGVAARVNGVVAPERECRTACRCSRSSSPSKKPGKNMTAVPFLGLTCGGGGGE